MWDANKIYVLRLRLGFSQSDLAQKLQITRDEVFAWEQGISVPAFHHTRVLELLDRHAESNSLETLINPIAESIIEKEDLSQVDKARIIEKL